MRYPFSFFKKIVLVDIVLLACLNATAQQQMDLNIGWQCRRADEVKEPGIILSQTTYKLHQWMPAVVPGTVLTTLLYYHKVPDPFYGMNNKLIPDIYQTGRSYYTYWFVKDFRIPVLPGGKEAWLHLRGVNNSCDLYLNGHKLNEQTHFGMFLRQEYNITPYLKKSGNRLAIVVYPPDPVGNPNGGQGGDGTIARNVGSQYTAGWDWIQPVHDRNTGIWDKVWIAFTGSTEIRYPHIVTEVPGARYPGEDQKPANIIVSAHLRNAAKYPVHGTFQCIIQDDTLSKEVSIPAGRDIKVDLSPLHFNHPKLWWPNGYGKQNLYQARLRFLVDGRNLSDSQLVTFGIRQINTQWDAFTRSMKILVNGQPIFIKGGNWIASDAMLRFSPERYNAEIRFHKEMNLNLIRVWGGSLTERPEFYDACDKYGLLVMQDFWISGDCNGRWDDPFKKDDQWIRRQYPDDHALFIASAADQIRMLRNHPSLAIWCGGNEMTPPDDILKPLRDSVLSRLDGTRWFVDYSNSDSMSYNSLGGNGDGPYGIQPVTHFWSEKTFPFNSEVGSVGTGDYESLKRFIPAKDLIPPAEHAVDSVWEYHKYIGYGNHIERYGPVKGIQDFAEKAQLVNYNQYRGLIEGFSSHIWQWYTGVIIWKTQNPWTALRGQMYDYYLDPNAGLYGLHEGSEPLHVMYDPVKGMVDIVNNGFRERRNLMLQVYLINIAGQKRLLTQAFEYINPSSVKSYLDIRRMVHRFAEKEGGFLLLRLRNTDKAILSENLYWLPDSTGQYSGLQQMKQVHLVLKAYSNGQKQVRVSLYNPLDGPVAFFNRISLVNSQTKERLLPVFYSNNYISVMPGETKTVTIDASQIHGLRDALVSVYGWNVPLQYIPLRDIKN